jgi:CRP-like cAMP-binding protein
MHRPRTGNAIIDLLLRSKDDDLRSILTYAEHAPVDAAAEIQRSGAPIGFALFPVNGMAALGWTFEDGSEVSTIGIGFDDAIYAAPGITLERAVYGARASLPLDVLKIPAARWQEFIDCNRPARRLLASYGECLLARTQHALACNARHDVESRFCRWLLDMDHCQGGKPLPVTHQTLARLLGVRRTTITLIAQSLQNAGIIAYRRGVIVIADLHALRQSSCECYKFDRTCRRALEQSAPLESLVETGLTPSD